MEKTKKMTKAQMFAQIKTNHALTADEIAFIDHEIELLAKKNASGEKKMTAKQTENLAIGEKILSTLERGKGFSISEIIKACDLRDAEGSLLATQRVSPICNRLVEEGKMVKTIEKRKTLFSLA